MPAANSPIWASVPVPDVITDARMLFASWALDLEANVGYVLGVKRAAELRPGSTLGTIPWLIARPYAGTRLTLVASDHLPVLMEFEVHPGRQFHS